MLLTGLHINSYKHLQNIDFEFIYPEGHPKAGLPLNKVCLIGQSATGKTSLLELIKNCVLNLQNVEIVNGKHLWKHFNNGLDGQIEFLLNSDSIKINKDNIIYKNQEYRNLPGSGGGSVGYLVDSGLKLLYLSAEIISKDAVNIFNTNPLNILNELATEKYSNLQKRYKNENFIYEFGQEVNTEIWFSLLYRILDYRKNFTQLASELINKGMIGDPTRLNREFEKWSMKNTNPLVPFAEKFNPILSKLNLDVDIINTEFPIPIKSKKREDVIPISTLSTGTKALLLTMFPLYELNTSDSIILLDEPERSLFPDIQIALMDHYQKLAPGAQFIVATHSPFIAAAFEPEERFILYFNEKGKVDLRQGESPIGDDPNDILQNDFNVDYYNDFGKMAYKTYVELKTRASQESEPAKKRKLIAELSKLGDKYNFG